MLRRRGGRVRYRLGGRDDPVPHVADAPDPSLPRPALTDEAAFRAFVDSPYPECYCNCNDEAVLGLVLNDYDFNTRDFFRWRVRLNASQATELVSLKLGTDVGRIVALEPVQRGPSGRLLRLRIVGRDGSIEIGKELQIRRALFPRTCTAPRSMLRLRDPRSSPGPSNSSARVGATAWGSARSAKQ